MISNTVRILEKYIPHAAAPLVAKMIHEYEAHVKISRSRSTKLGDYRHPYGGAGHRISINYNLNPYAFLITLVHEFAHLSAYNTYKKRVKPHGSEWKQEFRQLMAPFMQMNIFPLELKHSLGKYLSNPGASSCSDPNLMRILEEYNPQKPGIMYVEAIPQGSFFYTPNGRYFQKGAKRRTRFQCIEISSKRIYLFHALAKVRIADNLEGVA